MVHLIKDGGAGLSAGKLYEYFMEGNFIGAEFRDPDIIVHQKFEKNLYVVRTFYPDACGVPEIRNLFDNGMAVQKRDVPRILQADVLSEIF